MTKTLRLVYTWTHLGESPAFSAAPIRLPACHGAIESTILAYRLYNIGGNNPVALLKYIELIEEFLGRAESFGQAR